MEETRTRKKRKKKKINSFQAIGLLLLLVLLIIIGAGVKNIVSLQIEHNKLKKENDRLKSQRKELRLELKNVNSKEYIEGQARKQLRLVNPDEIVFVFPDSNIKGEDDGTATNDDKTKEKNSDSSN